MNLSKKELLVFLGLIILFFALRLPGVTTPYHQDEYKWPLYAEEKVYAPGSVPHPPLTEFIYRVVGKHIGLDNFRFIPLTFGFINLFLLFYLVSFIFDRKTAFWAVGLHTVSFYSILANLMVDVDGSVMPFFFLTSLIGYYKMRLLDFKLVRQNIKWPILLLLGIVGGFLIKVSFFLSIAAIGADFLFEKRVFSDKKKVLKYSFYASLAMLGLVLILLSIKYIFPFFDLSKALKYWEHFAVFSGRGWGQTFIQFAKSLMYISPMLLLPLAFVNRDLWARARPMFLFLFFATVFYLLVFDFSLGAIDRYFQFAVVPLSIIVGSIFASYIKWEDAKEFREKKYLYISISIAVIIFLIQLLPHVAPPLYPKSEWVGRVFSLEWNLLFPFMGGSGPIPFYMSFGFIALSFIASLVFVVSAIFRRKIISFALLSVLILGLSYNFAFTQEYLFGKINGSSKNLVKEALEYIEKDQKIKKVVVYNDNGGWDVRKTGKYARRMYATPEFEDEYKEYLEAFSGHVMFVGVPTLYKNSFYQQYFDSCEVVYTKRDKQIGSKIYKCN